MDTDQQRRRRGKPFPSGDLHAEPVIQQRVPEVLLALDEVEVAIVERPLTGAVRHESGDGLVGTPRVRCAPRHIRMALRLASDLVLLSIALAHVGHGHSSSHYAPTR